VIVGQGDGWLRSFDAKTGQLIWKCDLNPKGAKYELGGRCERSYVMATPVLYDGRIYIAPGQEIEHLGGLGHLYSIDPTGVGDISLELADAAGKGKPNPNSHVVWRYGGHNPDKKSKREFLFERTISNAMVYDGLVYATDIYGYAHCLDAKTGKLYWDHDLQSSCLATPLWVDGKVYVVTENGDAFIFAHGREKKQLAKIDMDSPIHASPVFANGVLYVMTESRLYAIEAKK
jgi:outer membrane protein assembly factor BamB